MKKVLLIVGLSFLLASNSFAGCKKDIKFSWYVKDNKEAHFSFKNNGSKHVRITKIYVSDSDGDRILEFKPKTYSLSGGTTRGLFVSPYKKAGTIAFNRDAARFGKTAGWKCSYQKPYETTIGDKAENAADAVGDFFGDLFKKDKED